MSLDSTETFSNVMDDTSKNETKLLGPEGGMYPRQRTFSSWCYLFVPRVKVENVIERLEKKFNIFVHKQVFYKKEKGHIYKEEKPTVSGLLFIQGEACVIQEYLIKNYFGLYLVHDCSTGKIAVIPDSVMQPFIKLSSLDVHRIRFMPHSLDYYAAGHTLVRITSGILEGMEGYQVRIAKDRCLITSIGGITVAIGKVNKESFENIDQYVLQRREEQHEESLVRDVELTPVQSEINKCFFHPQNQLDVVAIAGCLHSWIIKARMYIRAEKLSEAAEIALFLLEEVGNRFHSIYDSPKIGTFKELTHVCAEAARILSDVIAHSHASEDLVQYVETQIQSIAVRYPFLPIDR